ncbi:hypothetical protein DBR41_24300 [Pseudomonas sp. HMWF010]|nr:hypothetical protein DBR10_17120 [Caulobacter sp. HMWF025]PTT77375.1 hypothetical protein DBR41_24300 [Pseudomonas sp. HMWF010]
MEIIQIAAGRSVILPVCGVGLVREPSTKEREAAHELVEALRSDNASVHLMSPSLVALVRAIRPRNTSDFSGSPFLVARSRRLTTIEHRERGGSRWIDVRGQHQAIWRWLTKRQ